MPFTAILKSLLLRHHLKYQIPCDSGVGGSQTTDYSKLYRIFLLIVPGSSVGRLRPHPWRRLRKSGQVKQWPFSISTRVGHLVLAPELWLGDLLNTDPRYSSVFFTSQLPGVANALIPSCLFKWKVVEAAGCFP